MATRSAARTTAPVQPRTMQYDHAAIENIYRRRAVRDFQGERLDEFTVRRLLDAAVQAPTAVHTEPWAFVVVQDPLMLQRLSDRAKSIALEAAAEHHVLLNAPGAAPSKDVSALLASADFNIFYNAGTLIVICAHPLGPFVTADCWLAAENLMLAACAMGLGTCCIGLSIPVLNSPEVKQELGIPPEVAAVAPIIAGIPEHAVARVPRRSPEILRWIH